MICLKKHKRRSRWFDLRNETRLEWQFRTERFRGFRNVIDLSERHLGYRPNVREPQSYNEKILWRKLFDRRRMLVTVSDKVAVRDYITDKLDLGPDDPLLTQLYAVGTRVSDIDFTALPEAYAFKSNYAHARNILVMPASPLDHKELIRQTKIWRRTSHGKPQHEWAYQPIRRKLMVEELLMEEDGTLARDIKFAVFDGKCEFIVYCDDRFGKFKWYHMTPSWDLLLSSPPGKAGDTPPPKPDGFDDMLRLAERIGTGVDYFRVDFLFTQNRFALNEITLYDASGLDPLDPPIWDQRFGAFWTLPR